MSELKLKKLIVAITVGAVLLVVILSSIMVYQLISIRAENKRIEKLELKIAEYKKLIENGEFTIKERSDYEWLKREARKLGYEFR